MLARRLVVAAAVSLSVVAMGAAIAAPAALAEELCPNAAARQGPSAALPDCRAYEQLTPVDKGDSVDLFPSRERGDINDAGFAAEDGNQFLLYAESAFAGGDAFFSSYVFSRNPKGWTTTSLSPGPGLHQLQPRAFDPVDLSEVGLEDRQVDQVPGQPEEQTLTSFFGPIGGPYTTMASLPPTEPTGETGEVASRIVGASSDLSHVLLESRDHELAPGDAGQDPYSNALYDWVGGRPQLVNVATDGSLLSPCGAVLGLGTREYDGATHNAVSSDGSRVIFTAPDPYGVGAGCWNKETNENAPQLWMREEAPDGALRTVEISAPDPGVHDPAGPQPAGYVGASADGSKVFFMSSAELTPDDTTHAHELYEYNTEAPEGERLVRVSSGESGDSEGDVEFVGGISTDGSTVYFAANGTLAEGALMHSQEAGVNLYRYDTATKKTTFITKIESYAYPGTNGSSLTNWFDQGESPLTAEGDWYTTADGKYLLFDSARPLTGYSTATPNGAKCLENIGGEYEEPLCAELYRYDAANNEIVCVSCAGGAPVDNARFNRSALGIPSGTAPRPISEDGSYVFFETFNALVPQTTDTKLHVYEWHEGKISLISSATDPGDAFFLGSSANGSNVFFGTHAQLMPQDTDVNGDLYDARIDGGFVGLTPPQCTGTGCQGIPSAPPIFATPASVTFEGIGNFLPGPDTSAKPKAKALTKAQKRAQGLRACARDRVKRRRRRCEAKARTRYVTPHKSTKSTRRGK